VGFSIFELGKTVRGIIAGLLKRSHVHPSRETFFLRKKLRGAGGDTLEIPPTSKGTVGNVAREGTSGHQPKGKNTILDG